MAKKANVQHLVYGSAGVGVHGTGINSWESKSLIEAHMRALDLPVTVFRPMAFMELMTDQVCYPAVSTWHVMPKLMGSSRKIGWLSADNLGAIAAKVFAEASAYFGRELQLVTDVQSIDQPGIAMSMARPISARSGTSL